MVILKLLTIVFLENPGIGFAASAYNEQNLPPPCPENIELRWSTHLEALEVFNHDKRTNITPEDCRRFTNTKRSFDELLSAAGFKAGDVGFRIFPSYREYPDYNSTNAFYDHRCKCVGLPVNFIRKNGLDDWKVRAVIAHELGHAIQHKKAILNQFFTRSQLEAHADLLGAQIWAKARYPSKLYLAQTENFFTCKSIQTENNPTSSHPSDQDRWINLVLTEKAVSSFARSAASLNSPEKLDTFYSGRRASVTAGQDAPNDSTKPKSFKMIASPSDFNRYGSIITARPSSKNREPDINMPIKSEVLRDVKSQERWDHFDEAVWQAWGEVKERLGSQLAPYEIRWIAARTCGASNNDDLNSRIVRRMGIINLAKWLFSKL